MKSPGQAGRQAKEAIVTMIAVIGAGMIGETLISGLLRSGHPKEDTIATERRPERAEELADRYGIRVVANDVAVA